MARDTSWRSRLLQVSQLCQAVHLLNLVPETPQQVPSAHWGDHGLNLNLDLNTAQVFWGVLCIFNRELS